MLLKIIQLFQEGFIHAFHAHEKARRDFLFHGVWGGWVSPVFYYPEFYYLEYNYFDPINLLRGFLINLLG